MQISNNNNNNPSFGAYFNNKNAIHLKRLCKGEFDELSRYKLKDKLDWFAKELPNHELEVTQFENLAELGVGYTSIPIPGRLCGKGICLEKYSKKVINQIQEGKGKYTITNKDTGNSANIFADNIIQFLDGIKEHSETLFNKTKNSLTEGLDEFSSEIINKLTCKQ